MKQFITNNRHKVLQGVPSALLISFSIYLFLRIIFHDFPMSWSEEIFFFLKVNVIGSLLIIMATGSCTGMHSLYKKYRKQGHAA